MARFVGGDHFARGVPDFRFHAAAADGADHRPVFAHQQLRAFEAGDGAADLDDGRQRALLAQIAQVDQFVEYIHSGFNYSGSPRLRLGL